MADALVKNAADPEQVENARRKEKKSGERLKDAYAAVFQTIEGQMVWWDLLSQCGVNRTVIGATDAQTNFNAGRQDVGHWALAKVIESDPDVYVQMMRRAQENKP